MKPETLGAYWQSYQQIALPDIRPDGMTYRMARKTFLFGARAILSQIEDALTALPETATPAEKGQAVMAAIGNAGNELQGLLQPRPRPEAPLLTRLV